VVAAVKGRHFPGKCQCLASRLHFLRLIKDQTSRLLACCFFQKETKKSRSGHKVTDQKKHVCCFDASSAGAGWHLTSAFCRELRRNGRANK
jgi:hypothetical protein